MWSDFRVEEFHPTMLSLQMIDAFVLEFLGPRGHLRKTSGSRPVVVVPLSATKIHATSHYFFSFRL